MKSKILYIDDEVDLLELASSFFEDENLPIDTCSDFHGALKLIRENQYDLIISDAKMPSGSGQELFRIVKSEGLFSGKLILLTGHVESQADALKADYDYVIYKPIEFQDLVLKIKKLLE